MQCRQRSPPRKICILLLLGCEARSTRKCCMRERVSANQKFLTLFFTKEAVEEDDKVRRSYAQSPWWLHNKITGLTKEGK